MSRLQMIPERAYMEVFRDIVDEYLSEVTEAFPGLLSPAAEDGLEKAFWREAKLIAGDTLERMTLEIIARENPLAGCAAKSAYVVFDERDCLMDIRKS
ncbi:MAG: hypothetical protein Q4D15_10145 [Lachnospiraceae bacterium]|nr:hypothetical protein [Lachnospiraceae bacterium]